MSQQDISLFSHSCCAVFHLCFACHPCKYHPGVVLSVEWQQHQYLDRVCFHCAVWLHTHPSVRMSVVDELWPASPPPFLTKRQTVVELWHTTCRGQSLQRKKSWVCLGGDFDTAYSFPWNLTLIASSIFYCYAWMILQKAQFTRHHDPTSTSHEAWKPSGKEKKQDGS